jgi:phage tail sheath protein FI
MAYLHGVEVIDAPRGVSPTNLPDTAIIALIGVAPLGTANQMTIVQNLQQAAAFGPSHPDNTIRVALDSIFAEGSATVIVNNVGTSGHLASQTDTLTVANNRVQLTKCYVSTLVVSEGATTLVAGTDYSFDQATGIVHIINVNDYPDGTVLSCAYSRLNPALVSDGDIIGTVSGAGVRTGLKIFKSAETVLGIVPRILIAPSFSDRKAVSAEMQAQAEDLKIETIIDSPTAVDPADVVQGRANDTGDVENFLTANKRTTLCYPHVLRPNAYTGSGTVLLPYSSHLAGIRARVDRELGYWYSLDNKTLNVAGVERPLTFDLSDPNTEANLLNSKGVVVAIRVPGQGYRTWGSRNASFPSSADITNFAAVQRTADILQDAIKRKGMEFIGLPINTALITSIVETGNAFLRQEQAKGAIVDGKVTYLTTSNPPTQISNGQLTLELTFCPPPPLERLTYRSLIDINLLQFPNQ